jgi:hypothetical protein
MVLEEITGNGPDLAVTLGNLVRLIQIVLSIIGIYVLFWIISFLLNLRKNNVLKKILKNLEEINEKLGNKKLENQKIQLKNNKNKK